MIKLQCVCGHALSLPDHLAGQSIRCKRCQKVLKVPASGGGAAPAHAPAAPATSTMLVRGTRPCPSCGKAYPPSIVVCVECGINVDTGAMLYVSMEEFRMPAAAPGSAPKEAAEEPAGQGSLWARILRKLGLGRGS